MPVYFFLKGRAKWLYGRSNFKSEGGIGWLLGVSGGGGGEPRRGGGYEDPFEVV